MTTINSFYAPLQKLFAVIAILALVFAAFSAPSTFATEIQYEYRSTVQVKICHADGVDFSEGKQEVDAESILKKSGHGAHDDKGLDDKGDIITQFDYEYRVKNTDDAWISTTYTGKNLTTTYSGGYTGTQILNNNCDLPTPPTTGSVTVTKEVINNNSGTAEVSDFSLFVGVTTVQSGESVEVAPGTYPVTETGAMTSSYDATFSGACSTGSITVEAGKTYNCTITNDDKEPTPTYQCNDGVDNADPEDILFDYPADPGCSGPTDDDETDPVIPAPVCAIGSNLLKNGSFEMDIVTDNGGTWQKFTNPTNWLVSLSNTLEIWANGFYGGASEGDQNAELDGDAPTMITQTVATVPGATYELSFDFSARPDADSAADNSVDALVDDNLLMNVTADGSNIAVNTWSPHTKTFVAGGNSTNISFKDVGTANSYGTLIDNAVLCFVSAPVPGCMDPEATNYNEKATIDDDSCDYGNDGPKVCTVTLVSGDNDNEDDRDDNTTVVERADARAFIVEPHPLWPAVVSAGWVWGDAVVQNTAAGETQTFERGFGWQGAVTSATLTVSTDDSHSATLNGDFAGSMPTASHVSGQGVYNVKSLINQGNNDLSIAVTNIGNGNPEWNPAGLAYKLVIQGEVTSDDDCVVPYVDEPLYEIYGIVWHDENENDVKDESVYEQSEELIEEGEESLAGWLVTITNGTLTYTDETDAYGRYEFNVPAGTWTITETMQTNWSQTFPNSGSHVVTVPELYTNADSETGIFASVMNALVPTAHAAVAYPKSYGSYDFGNVYKAPSTPSPSSDGRGGNGRYVSLTDSNPDGDVAGDTTSRPEGEVLGDSISVMPVGAPNTGAGGAAPLTATPMMLAMLGMIGAIVTLRSTRNG